MASNTSAVIDVIIENKEIPSILRENRDYDRSSMYSNYFENSLVQSPSLESFSTIHDMENLSELNVDENLDLCVKIDNPQKHLETLETYITFRIITKVARIEFSENEYIVRRRYNDFVWLRHKLVESHPFCIIPPLPGKHSLIGQLDRYSKEFIILRMKSLNVFMSRVVQHPILSCNDHLKVFLTSKQPDFNLYRRQRTNSGNIVKVASNSFSSHVAIKHRHMEFEKTRSYLHTLSEKLSCIEKISNRINKERHDYVSELNNFHPIFTTWSATEPEINKILRSIAGAIEKNAMAQTNLISSYSNIIGNPIKDFLVYIDVVQETLHKRENFQGMYDLSMDELSKKRVEKDQLVACVNDTTQHSTTGFSLFKQPSIDEKLEKLGTHIPQLVKKVEMNQDNLECANESLRSDLQRWQQEKRSCIKKILLGFVSKQIEYYEKNVSAWENVTSELAEQNISARPSTK